ncbi:transposase [Hyalomma marginatum]|nr:transposase [Hyalomma marginatum]
MSFTQTPGNTDDRVVVEKLAQHLTGLLFGDRGYISKMSSNPINPLSHRKIDSHLLTSN